MVFPVAQNGGFPGFDEVTRHSGRVRLEIARHGVLLVVDLGMKILGPADVCSAGRLTLAALTHPRRSTPLGPPASASVPGPHECSKELIDCVPAVGNPHRDDWARMFPPLLLVFHLGPSVSYAEPRYPYTNGTTKAGMNHSSCGAHGQTLHEKK